MGTLLRRKNSFLKVSRISSWGVVAYDWRCTWRLQAERSGKLNFFARQLARAPKPRATSEGAGTKQGSFPTPGPWRVPLLERSRWDAQARDRFPLQLCGALGVRRQVIVSYFSLFLSH